MMKSFVRGLTALLIVAAILLASDFRNRNLRKVKVTAKPEQGLAAVKGRTYRMGFCYFAPDPSHDELIAGLWKRLGELGFVRDSNLLVKESHANAEIGNIPSILLNLDNMELDMILVTSTPCVVSAMSSVRNHPVGFTYCSDPLGAGVGKSYTDHAKGITGIGSFPPVGKTVEFILETIPGASRIGIIYNNAEANSRSVVNVLRKLQSEKGFTLVETSVTSTSEVFQAMQSLLSKNIDVVLMSNDNTAAQALNTISSLCMKESVPLLTNDGAILTKGMLAAIGPGWRGVGYHSGDLIAKLLNGASPDTVPVENFVNEEISLDQERAKELGLTIPSKYLVPAAGTAFSKKAKIALVHYVDSPNSEECEKGIRDALSEKNLKEDVDFTMKVLNAQGDVSTLNSIAGSLSNERWDLVFCTSTPTIQLLSKKLSGQKIVFTNVGDPIAAGLGKSASDHMANICGVSTMSDFDGLVSLAMKLKPGIKRIGTVFTPSEVNSVIYKDHLLKAAEKMGLKLVTVPANTAPEVLDASNSLVSQRIDAFCQISDNLTSSASAAIIKTARESRIPYFGFISAQARQGAVAVCARDYRQAGYEAGMMGIEVLKGSDPGRIPFRNVSKTLFIVNEESARVAGLRIPDDLKTGFPNVEILRNK